MELGRLDVGEKAQPVLLDSPTKVSQALVSKIDELIDALKALDAANTGVPEVAALEKIKFKL